MITDREFTHRLVRTLVAVALAVVIVWALYLARRALLVVYLSILLAMAFAPVVRLIERKGRPGDHHVPRVVAIFVLYVAILAALCGIALAIVPPLITQGEQLWTQLPEFLNNVQGWLHEHHLLSSQISLRQAVGSAGGQTVGRVATTAASTFATVVFSFITIVILTFYMLVDARALSHAFARLFPPEQRVQVIRTSHEIVGRVNAWLIAHLMLAIVMGAISALGLGLLGAPFYFVLALVTAAGEMIPVLGAFVSGAFAVLMSLTASVHTAVYVLIFFVAAQQLEGNVLVPLIMKDRVGLGAVTVIVALTIGFEIAGIMGAVLAVPSAAILKVLFEELMPEDRTTPSS
jgi:predicted PurR-regulated permease PerM